MATLQLSAEKFDELTDCTVCLKTYTDPQALPCQHYLCLPCAEKILEKGKSECPICRQAFTKDQLRPFRFLSQLDEIVERTVCQPKQMGVCSECRRRVRDKDKDLRRGTKFKGDICADCAATEELVKSMEPPENQERVEFCLDVTCPGSPTCSKRHVSVMTM